MIENMIFDFSSIVSDKQDIKEIEFWGHDAGEFVSSENVDTLETTKEEKEPIK